MSTSLWLPISSCANFSLQLSLISQLLLSLHRSPAFCMSFSGSFTFSLPCYAALATVTTSQDLIWTLLPQLSSPSSLRFPHHSWVLASDFFLLLPLFHRIQSSPFLAAALQRRSCQAWKSCSTHHLQVRIVFNESYKPKAENWHAGKFTHTHTNMHGHITHTHRNTYISMNPQTHLNTNSNVFDRFDQIAVILCRLSLFSGNKDPSQWQHFKHLSSTFLQLRVIQTVIKWWCFHKTRYDMEESVGSTEGNAQWETVRLHGRWRNNANVTRQ